MRSFFSSTFIRFFDSSSTPKIKGTFSKKNPKNWNTQSSSIQSLCGGDLQKKRFRETARREREREREINDRGKDDDDDDKKRGDFFARVDFEGLRDEQRSISESTPTRIPVVFVGKNVSRGGGSREGGGGGSRRRRRRR